MEAEQPLSNLHLCGIKQYQLCLAYFAGLGDSKSRNSSQNTLSCSCGLCYRLL